ncbi:MAG: UbiH/UbiF/VisC/COQ6 family ubiquinone biosynthesis hydroxylase [Gammaproteobacteria bacterium]
MTAGFDVAVVGGGMVGLALAALLHAEDGSIRVAVVDAGPTPAFDESGDVGLRVSAISPGSRAVLERCGVWSAICRSRFGTYSAMCVWDAQGEPEGSAALRFAADELGLPELGHIVENELIRDRLYHSLDGSDRVAWYFGRRVSELQPGMRTGRLLLEDGEALNASLVVGADGARSTLRRLAGLTVRTRRYPQDALVTHVRPERRHDNTAWQRFLPSGPVALLPLGDGRCSVVWSVDTEACRELSGMDDEALGYRITEATGGVLGALQVDAPRATFPLSAAWAPEYVGQRVVLAGDAAHAVHPLAGQGVNLGFGDVAELSDRIAAARRNGEDPGDRPVLRRYERARKGENMRTLMFLDALQRFFGMESPVATRVRMNGMRLFNRVAPLKRMAVRHATGLAETA